MYVTNYNGGSDEVEMLLWSAHSHAELLRAHLDAIEQRSLVDACITDAEHLSWVDYRVNGHVVHFEHDPDDWDDAW